MSDTLWRVPDTMTVIGFDLEPLTEVMHAPLTTVARRPEGSGAKAAELLAERLGGGPEQGRRIDLPFEPMVRQSV